MTKLQASCTNASTGITNFKQVTAQLQTSAQTLTDKLAAQKQKVADLEAAYEKSRAETGENSEETKKLATQLEQVRQKVSQTEQALNLVTRQLKLSQNGFYQLGTQLENIGAKLESVGKKVSQVGQQLTTRVTTPIVALGTVCVKTFTCTSVSSHSPFSVSVTVQDMGVTVPRPLLEKSVQSAEYTQIMGITSFRAYKKRPTSRRTLKR